MKTPPRISGFVLRLEGIDNSLFFGLCGYLPIRNSSSATREILVVCDPTLDTPLIGQCHGMRLIELRRPRQQRSKIAVTVIGEKTHRISQKKTPFSQWRKSNAFYVCLCRFS